MTKYYEREKQSSREKQKTKLYETNPSGECNVSQNKEINWCIDRQQGRCDFVLNEKNKNCKQEKSNSGNEIGKKWIKMKENVVLNKNQFINNLSKIEYSKC